MGLVKTFYAGQTVLITGGSGFVGKVVLLRLLEQCDCRRIVLLLRAPGSSPGKSRSQLAQERLEQQVLSSPVFDALRQTHGANFLSFIRARVGAVAGDLRSPDLGLDEGDKAQLQRSVSVIFHIAASVHFNSPLQENYAANVEGSLRVLQFALSCSCMQLFLHTSTCYVNSDLTGKVPEGIVPLPWNTMDLLLAVQRFNAIATTKPVSLPSLLPSRISGLAVWSALRCCVSNSV